MNYAGTQILDIRIIKAGFGPGIAIVCPCLGFFFEPFAWRLDVLQRDGCLLLSIGPLGFAIDIGCRLLRCSDP